MAIIELQDPLSTEIQSSTIAGTIEALNRVSQALDLNQESVEKAPMNPVSGLDPEDPRRIYQVDNGNRLWLASPTPQIYVNDSEILSSEKDFSIDLIGGSVTFEGSYRPSQSDAITASFAHISPTQVFGGSEILITFSEDFLGQPFTVSGGDDETYSGIVEAGYKSSVRVKSINTTYTISAENISGERYSTEVEIGPYYGRYSAYLASFIATIRVSIWEPPRGVIARATLNDYSVSGEAGSDGTVTLSVGKSGNYTVNATYSGANSNSKSVDVSQSGQEYPVSVEFITLTVTAPEGSTITAKNGATTLTDTGGIVKFYLPNTGTWTVSASLGGDSTSDSVQCNAYQNYSVELSYAPPENMNDATWEVLHKYSATGQLSNYYDVGDGKDVTLNGTVGSLKLTNFVIMAFIMGFNHNASLEGSNKTHFALGKISGKMVAFCDSNYDSKTSSTAFHMNSSATNSGGWASSYMRKTVLGNSSSPSSPSSNSLMAVLPSDLRAVMQPVTKYTNNKGKSTSSSAVTSTVDYLWIPSEFEWFGDISYGNTYEKNKQKQYDYFAYGNSWGVYKHSSVNTYAYIWSRSATEDLGDSFVRLESGEYFSQGLREANLSQGLFSLFAI